MIKSIEEHFADWEADAIGYGYGTGEPHTLQALKDFLWVCPPDGGCKYQTLERRLGEPVTWLLISILCKAGVLDYGSSPRYVWLTKRGKVLREFVDKRSCEDLVKICCEKAEGYFPCYPDACNCGPLGYEKGVKCPNPFWGRATEPAHPIHA